MRNLERVLVAANSAASLLAGWYGQLLWLPLSLAAFAAYVAAKNRALRRQIGAGHWPSAGFARFTLGTNLYVALKSIALGGVLFALAHAAKGILGF